MSNFEYSGRDNLDIMSLAVNYNSSIYKWLSHDTKIGSSVLDFGSGQGEFYYRFNSYCDNVYAVEPDVNMHNLLIPTLS